MYQQILNELTYNGFVRKQKSVTSLFPTFHQRVAAVASRGGIELMSQFPEVWQFKVSSGTKPGVRYDVALKFKNIPEMIKKFASDRRLWNKAGTNVDLRLLSSEILNNVDMEADCSCPADTFWGPEYIKTKRDAQFGDKEYRPPDVRNPRQYGIICKHSHEVFADLPMYNSTFANHLKSFYSKDIANAVAQTTKHAGTYKRAAAELQAKEIEPAKDVEPTKDVKPTGGSATTPGNIPITKKLPEKPENV